MGGNTLIAFSEEKEQQHRIRLWDRFQSQDSIIILKKDYPWDWMSLSDPDDRAPSIIFDSSKYQISPRDKEKKKKARKKEGKKENALQ